MAEYGAICPQIKEKIADLPHFARRAMTRYGAGNSRGPRSANSGCEQSQQKKLLDHLVGGDTQPRWHGQAERTLGDWSSN